MAIGLCYPFAMQKARKWYADHVTVDYSGKRPKVIVHPDRDNLDKFKVVHGTTTNKWSGDAKPVFHAWVQMGDMIFDDQTKHTKPNGIDEATYYDVFSAEPKNEYTAKQAIAKCSLKGTEGPWDAKSIAKMKARDAWLGENKVNIKQIIKEELTKYLEEIPQTPTDAGRKMGQDPTGDETSTLGLEEAEGDEADSLGADRTIEKVWQSLQDNAGQAHKDLQMLAIHLGNAGSTIEKVNAAANTMKGILDLLDTNVKPDVQKVVLQAERGYYTPS